MSFDAALRLERNILRRWLNAIATVEERSLAGAGNLGSGSAAKCTTAECTFGGGENDSGGSAITISALAFH